MNKNVKIQIKTRVLLVILVELYNQVNVYVRTQNGIVHSNASLHCITGICVEPGTNLQL